MQNSQNVVKRFTALAAAVAVLVIGAVSGASAHDFGSYKGHSAGSCGGTLHRQCIYQASRNPSSGHQHYYQHNTIGRPEHYRWQGGVY